MDDDGFEEGLDASPRQPAEEEDARTIDPFAKQLLDSLPHGIIEPQQLTALELDDLQLHTGLRIVEIRKIVKPKLPGAREFLQQAASTSQRLPNLCRTSFAQLPSGSWLEMGEGLISTGRQVKIPLPPEATAVVAVFGEKLLKKENKASTARKLR